MCAHVVPKVTIGYKGGDLGGGAGIRGVNLHFTRVIPIPPPVQVKGVIYAFNPG
jgi:hypothetical protein